MSRRALPHGGFLFDAVTLTTSEIIPVVVPIDHVSGFIANADQIIRCAVPNLRLPQCVGCGF